MAHLHLKQAGWAKLVLNDHSLPHLAEKLGVSERALERILEGKVRPDERFIAGCLYHFPLAFAELFDVSPETGPVEEPPRAVAQ